MLSLLFSYFLEIKILAKIYENVLLTDRQPIGVLVDFLIQLFDEHGHELGDLGKLKTFQNLMCQPIRQRKPVYLKLSQCFSVLSYFNELHRHRDKMI